ncbi:hypothetical protein GCM10027452_42870 [Micromonospora halotolerans]
MAETFADQDLTTLRSIARGAGITDTERMPHDELVDMLRRAGLADPDARHRVVLGDRCLLPAGDGLHVLESHRMEVIALCS